MMTVITKASGKTRPPSPHKSVLVVTNVLTYAVHHRLHLFERLISEGYNVTLAGSGTAEEKAALEAVGVTVRDCAVVPYRLSPLRDVLLLPAIRRVIMDVKPDVLHLFTSKPILFGKLALASLPAKFRPALVLSLTGLGRLFVSDAGPVKRVLRMLVLRAIQHPLRGTKQSLTVETHSDKSELVDLTGMPKKTVVVTNGTGVDLDAFASTQRTGPVTFLFAGRLLKSKGVLLFAEAARQLATQGIDARFIIAGYSDPKDDDSVPTRAFDAYRDVPGFEFKGEVPPTSMPALLAEADVVCLPTQYKEGIPRSLLEAAASGCTFIACRTPGWIETMGPTSAAGWYVNPSDVTGLTEAMKAAALDRTKTRNAGEVARRIVLRSNVTCQKVQERYLDAYERAQQDKDLDLQKRNALSFYGRAMTLVSSSGPSD